MEYEYIPMGYSWKGQIKNNIKLYNGSMGLIHGFQKDAIQNSVGAKKGLWENWECKIDLIEKDGISYIIISDYGTFGMTGDNMTSKEILAVIDNSDGNMPKYQRLARFSTLHTSGQNDGPGLFGIGKLMYPSVSKDISFYFESVSVEGYRLNHNNKGTLLPLALEGEQAIDFLEMETGFSPRTLEGTSMIIPNPKKELIDAVNDGMLSKYISETWWRILLKYDAKIFLNGSRINIPECYNFKSKLKHSFDLKGQDYGRENSHYIVKHFGFKILDEVNHIHSGFFFYRKGMKIGEIPINIPEKYKGRYIGYIEVADAWESELAEIEDATHYNVQRFRKSSSCYAILKNYVKEKTDELLYDWNIKKQKVTNNKKLRNDLEEIAEELKNIFNNYGVEGLSSGPKSTGIKVRLKDVTFPEEESQIVYDKSFVKFRFIVKNENISKIKLEIKIFTEFQNRVLFELFNNEIIVNGKSSWLSDEISLCIDQENSVKFEKNNIKLHILRIGFSKTIVKNIPYYFSTHPEEKPRNIIKFTNNNKIFPKKGTRRINTNESLKMVNYSIENLSNYSLDLAIRVSSHNSQNSNSLIENIHFEKFTLEPFSIKDVLIDDINFSKEVYYSILKKGRIDIRSKIIADKEILKFEKGEIISDYSITTYFNIDEKIGTIDDFDPKIEEDFESKLRSRISRKSIHINIAHPSYKFVEGSDFEKDYLRKEMLRQYVYLYLEESNFSILKPLELNFLDLDYTTKLSIINKKIDELFYNLY